MTSQHEDKLTCDQRWENVQELVNLAGVIDKNYSEGLGNDTGETDKVNAVSMLMEVGQLLVTLIYAYTHVYFIIC